MRKIVKQRGGWPFATAPKDKTMENIIAAKEKLRLATQNKYEAQRKEDKEIKNVEAAEGILIKEALQALKSSDVNSFEELFNKIEIKDGFYDDVKYGDYNYMKQDEKGSGHQQALYVYKNNYKDDKVKVYIISQ